MMTGFPVGCRFLLADFFDSPLLFVVALLRGMLQLGVDGVNFGLRLSLEFGVESASPATKVESGEICDDKKRAT